METFPAKKTIVRIAVIDSDPLRFLGFRALLSSEPDFELRAVSLGFSPCSSSRHPDPQGAVFLWAIDRSPAGKKKYSGCWLGEYETQT